MSPEVMTWHIKQGEELNREIKHFVSLLLNQRDHCEIHHWNNLCGEMYSHFKQET